jgi:hypothetical protein
MNGGGIVAGERGDPESRSIRGRRRRRMRGERRGVVGGIGGIERGVEKEMVIGIEMGIDIVIDGRMRLLVFLIKVAIVVHEAKINQSRRVHYLNRC